MWVGFIIIKYTDIYVHLMLILVLILPNERMEKQESSIVYFVFKRVADYLH